MAELTKEWLLRTIAELEEERDSMPGVVNVDAAMALAAMKLALASLEAKDKIPELRQVIYHFRDWNEGFPVERFKADYVISWMLVNYPPAQPAPVSVPDERAVELLATDLMKRIDKITGERHSVVTLSSLRVSIVEACRAAMLQGVENAETPTTMQTAPALDSSPKNAESASSNSPVTPDGWVMVPVEPTEDMIVNGFESEPDESFSDEKEWATYDAMSGCQQAAHRAKLCWAAMIAAAPQQEVK